MLDHSTYSKDKKLREYKLIEEFLTICPDFKGYKFVKFSENPDLIYQSSTGQIGFDSVIISQDQAAAECYFDASLCRLTLPSKLSADEQAEKILVFFENKLFMHWRRYSLATVLVFSLVGSDAQVFDRLAAIIARFKLPEFSMYNISDYYLCDSKKAVKLAESPSV